jgi:hypothetical protein
MSTTYSGTATHRESVEIPSDSDKRNWTIVGGSLQNLKDETEYLRGRIPGAGSLHRRYVDVVSGYSVATGSVWNKGTGSGDVAYWTQSQLSNNRLVFEITPLLPHVCMIIGFGAVINPPNSHAGLPATMPTIDLLRRSILDAPGTPWSLIVSSTDSSADVATYEAIHLTGPASTSTSVNLNIGYRWALSVVGEGGANSLVGLEVYTAYVSVGS